MTGLQNQAAPETKETEFVRRAVRGDAEAFARLYELYVERIYRYLFFRVGEVAAAEDLTSQVFLNAWEGLGRYQWRGLPFGAWLFRIARNTLIDAYRKSRPETSLEAETTNLADPEADVDEAAARRIQSENLRGLLEKLTNDQRQVLTLKFLSGLSTEEVAQVLGKRPGAVRALQMRGLQALAQLIEGDDD